MSQQPPAAPSAHATKKQFSVKNVTLIGDSMSNDITMNRMIPDRSGEKIKCSTLVDAIARVKIMKNVANFVIQTGINDTKETSDEVVKQSYITLIDTIKQYHPRSKIYVCTLIPPKNDPRRIEELNRFIVALGERKSFSVIPTHRDFLVNQDLYKDWCHPNYKGTATIVREIKMALGMNTGPYYRHYTESGALRPQNSGNTSSNDQRFPSNNTSGKPPGQWQDSLKLLIQQLMCHPQWNGFDNA